MPCTSTGASPISLMVVAKLRRALRRRAEEVVPDRLPVGADQIEHQRGAIGVAGLGEAIELIVGHWGSCLVRGASETASPPCRRSLGLRNGRRRKRDAPAAGCSGRRSISAPCASVQCRLVKKLPGQPPSGAMVPSWPRRRAGEIHAAGRRIGRRQDPAAGHDDIRRAALRPAVAPPKRIAGATRDHQCDESAAGDPALSAFRNAHLHFMVGITNSAPSLVPDGQREVTVLVLV